MVQQPQKDSGTMTTQPRKCERAAAVIRGVHFCLYVPLTPVDSSGQSHMLGEGCVCVGASPPPLSADNPSGATSPSDEVSIAPIIVSDPSLHTPCDPIANTTFPLLQ